MSFRFSLESPMFNVFCLLITVGTGVVSNEMLLLEPFNLLTWQNGI